MNDLEAIAAEQGVFLRRQALDRGYDDKDLRAGMRAGRIVRVRHGAYAPAATWSVASPAERHLIRASAVALQAHAAPVLSHTTAALALGAEVWDMPLDDIHVTRTNREAGRREAGVARHRGRLSQDEIIEVGGRRCTSAVRTALDITAITDVERALVVVCSLLAQKKLTKAALVAALPSWRHTPGSLTTAIVVRLADRRLTSVGESRTYHALWSAALPLPMPQYEVNDEFGRLFAKLDFAWPELRVWLEFDGVTKYVKFLRKGEDPADAVVREKRREDEIRRLTGWICVRITWADLARPGEIARKLRKAFADAAAARAA